MAFEDLKPFPRRQEIMTKQTVYMSSIKEKLKKKEQQRRIFDESEQMVGSVLVYYSVNKCENCIDIL